QYGEQAEEVQPSPYANSSGRMSGIEFTSIADLLSNAHLRGSRISTPVDGIHTGYSAPGFRADGTRNRNRADRRLTGPSGPDDGGWAGPGGSGVELPELLGERLVGLGERRRDGVEQSAQFRCLGEVITQRGVGVAGTARGFLTEDAHQRLGRAE